MDIEKFMHIFISTEVEVSVNNSEPSAAGKRMNVTLMEVAANTTMFAEETTNFNKPYNSFAILHVSVRWKGWIKNLLFSFCAYFFGEHDPRVAGEKERLVGIQPVQEHAQIGESRFLPELGILSESWDLVELGSIWIVFPLKEKRLVMFSNGIQQQKIIFTEIQSLQNEH